MGVCATFTLDLRLSTCGARGGAATERVWLGAVLSNRGQGNRYSYPIARIHNAVRSFLRGHPFVIGLSNYVVCADQMTHFELESFSCFV
jgi:hypothetical protein